MTRPDCRICHGMGWYEAPVHSPEFEPRIDLTPCPNCNPVEGTPLGCLLWTLALVGFLTLVCLVAP